MSDTEIAYQNKDIMSKFLAEHLKGKSFEVYGLRLPEIQRVLPTNIPTVKVNELRLDNLFELADGTAAIVDYESVYREADKVKYLNYLTGIANRFLGEDGECPQLRMIVIYTGDIRRQSVACEYDIGALTLRVECAFLSELDSDEVFGRLERKVRGKERLRDGELMEFIVLPLSYWGKKRKQQHLQEVVDLAAMIEDEVQQTFALTGILTFTDKVIDREMADGIRRKLDMTKVAQIFEEEKQRDLRQQREIMEEDKHQALKQQKEILEEDKRQALKEANETHEKEKREIVMNMIRQGYSTENIVSLVLGYSQKDVAALRRKLAEEAVE